MTYEEFLLWMEYFKRRPIGWREDDRAMKFLQTQGVKAKPWKIFPSLDAIYHPVKNKKPGFDVAGFRASGLFQKLMSAKGGDKLDLKINDD